MRYAALISKDKLSDQPLDARAESVVELIRKALSQPNANIMSLVSGLS